MKGIDCRSLGLRYNLKCLAHSCVLGTCSCLCLRGVRPHGRDGDDVFDGRGAQNTLGELMLEDLLGVSAEGGEVVGTESLCRDSVAWGEGMLVRELSAQIGNAAGLGRVEVELEPLMAGAEVVNLETPVAFIAFVAELTKFPLEFIAPVGLFTNKQSKSLVAQSVQLRQESPFHQLPRKKSGLWALPESGICCVAYEKSLMTFVRWVGPLKMLGTLI